MQELIEHNVGLIVAWAPIILSLVMIAAAAGVWWLGRGRRMLIPAGWVRRSVSLLVLLIGVATASALFQTRASVSPKVDVISRLNAAVGSRIPDLSFRLVADDGPQRLRQYAGNVLVINHWATWCPPCLAEMPTLGQVQDALADRESS